MPFDVLPSPPTISSINPTSGKAGDSIVITGTGFTNVSSVTFNGAGASFVVDSVSQITATVPQGASSGPLVVTTAGGDATASFSAMDADVYLSAANLFTKRQAVAPVTLAYAASVAPDLSLSNSFLMTLTGSLTLDNPTNLVAGASFTFTLSQDATGGRTIAFGTAYKFPGGTAPTLTINANAKDKLFCHSDDGLTLDCVLNKDFR